VPAQWATTAAWEEPLAALAAHGIGRAAVRRGRVLGTLVGWPVDASGTAPAGTSRVYCPEGAAGVAPDFEPGEARRLLEGLVEAAERDWVRAGIRTHLVSATADDMVLRETLAWLGFGISVVDALATTEAFGTTPANPPSDRAPSPPVVRLAGPADLGAVLALEIGLRDHLVDSPTYLVLGEPLDRSAWEVSLADPAFATFMAIDATAEAVGFLRIGPPADDVAPVVRDPGTASVSRAFTLADRRGAGIAAGLLGAAVAWAADRGAIRIGVDFESANVLATRFWTAHFSPVVLTHRRMLDPAAGTPEAGA
jgi:GNAT superfamily N-acetyltransferase